MNCLSFSQVVDADPWAVAAGVSASEGTFEVSVGCAALGVDGPGETCAASLATCGDTLVGTTRGFPSFLTTSRAPDHTYQLAALGPTLVSASTCGSDLTNFRVVLLLFAGHPDPGVDRRYFDFKANPFSPFAGGSEEEEYEPPVLLADSRATSGGCATLVAELPKKGAYWLVVSGLRDEDEGEFEVRIGCSDLLQAYAAPRPLELAPPPPGQAADATAAADGGDGTLGPKAAFVNPQVPTLPCGGEVVGTAAEAPLKLYQPWPGAGAPGPNGTWAGLGGGGLGSGFGGANGSSGPLPPGRQLDSRAYLVELEAPAMVSASSCSTNHRLSKVAPKLSPSRTRGGVGVRISIYRLAPPQAFGGDEEADVQADDEADDEEEDEDDGDEGGGEEWVPGSPFPRSLLFTSTLPDNSASPYTYVPNAAARAARASKGATAARNGTKRRGGSERDLCLC